MTHRLREGSLHVRPGSSLVAPVEITGLPATIDALGLRWQRKREFHVTAASASTLEAAGADRPDLWERIVETASGRSIGPITARGEIRRVSHPDTPGLQTLIVMVEAAGLATLYRELSAALDARLDPPPAHITLYSSDPDAGIGISSDAELSARAPALPETDRAEIRRAMGYDNVFADDGGIPLGPIDALTLPLGETDQVFTPDALRALTYVAHVHRRQRRKATGIPYLAHLISVAALVAEDGGGEVDVIVALLHDTAEDHGGEPRLDDVARRFGPEIASMVRALSDSLRPEGVLKERWLPRKRRYIAQLRTESRAEVLRVSNADKLHNARAILADHRQVGAAIWARFEGSPAEQLWYYGELAAIFAERRQGSALARELSETVGTLAREIQAEP